ncbi:MAG: alpha/beta hydrolase family esterase [Micavibrio sp.]
MTIIQKTVISFLTLCLITGNPALAEGPIRERMKERFKERALEKLENQPAPETTAPIDQVLTQAGDYTFSFPHQGLTRYYRVHIPPQYNPAQKTPLILAFHGGGGDMNYMARDELYGLVSKADQEGTIIIFPSGYSRFPSGKLATWNAGECCADARDENIDDVGFIEELIGHAHRQMSIDKNRIYAIGMSNGAMMSYRLACELPDIFAAIGAVAGTDNTLSCNPSRTVSVLHIHARNDTHVLFNGGAGEDAFRDKSKVADFTSVSQTIDEWLDHNQCRGKPQRILNTTGATCDLYSDCAEGSKVQLCVTEEGGHSWPGGNKPRGEAPTRALSANDAIWNFFKSL